jgi:UDP-N-acetylmuramyl pentapeptide phosphotransferase/UDP-N-acetylglucosamine-1-phosphate transferase
MVTVFVTTSVAFLITFLAIPAIMRVAEQKKLFDLPDSRKLHTRPIASLGGVGIFMGFALAVLLTLSGPAFPEFRYFLAAAILIFFLGIKDDILILSPSKKFMVQLAAAGILIHLGNIRIESMHGLLGITTLPTVVGLVLSYATLIVVINAFNLIDGVDGLAGSLGLLSMAVFGTYFLWSGLSAYAVLAFAMGGSLMAFLYFNYNPAKIFMGDSGSLLVGLVNAILVVKFIQVAGSSALALPAGSSIALGVSILMVPLADTLRVFSIRLYQGRSPFSPDRNHIHHLLLSRGYNHKQVTLTCLVLNASFICIGYFGRSMGALYVLGSLIALCAFFMTLLHYMKPITHLKPLTNPLLQSGSTRVLPQPATKVVSLNAEMALAESAR